MKENMCNSLKRGPIERIEAMIRLKDRKMMKMSLSRNLLQIMNQKSDWIFSGIRLSQISS